MVQRTQYLQQLIDSMGNDLVKTITGIRRCGKSVLLRDIFGQWLKDNAWMMATSYISLLTIWK